MASRRNAIMANDRDRRQGYVKRTPAKDVLWPLYERADRDLPKNLSIVLAGRRKSIQDKLDVRRAHHRAMPQAGRDRGGRAGAVLAVYAHPAIVPAPTAQRRGLRDGHSGCVTMIK
jgi:hypothetical protein